MGRAGRMGVATTKSAALLLGALLVSLFGSSILSNKNETPQSSLLRYPRRLLQIDPKSVEAKPLDESTRYLVLSSRNGYSYFMHSKHPQPAYPAIISSASLNLVEVRDLTAEYPALCLKTLIGGIEHIFDVILIEYSHILDTSPSAVAALSTRLRHRFPKSLIIFIRLWYPIQITYNPKDWSLRRWMAEKGVLDFDGEKVRKKLLATAVTDWSFYEEPEILAQLDEIAQSVDGHIWELPKPANIPEALLQFGHLFDGDFLRLALPGHQYVAQEISRVVSTIPREPPTLNPWQEPDQCISWYGVGIEANIPYQNMSIKKIDLLHNRWALECGDDDKKDCTITVKSELNVMATVYIQYMATGPRPVYLSYEASLGNQPVVPIEANLPNSPYALHIQQMTAVGIIAPGDENSIFVHLKKGGKGLKFLKVTGVLISPVQIGNNEVESS
jgi:hypothetical protein